MVPEPLGAHHHLHLKGIPFTRRLANQPRQHILLIQPIAPREIAHPRPQDRISKEVGPPRHKLALQVPPEHAPAQHPTRHDRVRRGRVPRACHDIGAGGGLHGDEARQRGRVVAEIGVHDDDKVAGGVGQAVRVRGAEAEFACARLEVDGAGGFEVCGEGCDGGGWGGVVGFLELACDVLRAVGGGVVDYY